MTQNYFIDQQRHFRTLKTSTRFGLSSLILLIVLNLITFKITGLMLISLILGGAVLIWVISLWRSLFLLCLPIIQIDDHTVSYFNVLWYNRHKWDKFEISHFDPEANSISIGLMNGRMFDKLLLESLSDEAIESIKKQFVDRGKMGR